MFKELDAVARHTPINLMITPQDGGRLKVIVTPLPTGKAKDFEGLSKTFSVIGTPEELDADFLTTLNTYAAKVTEVRTQVGLPLDELDKVKESAAKKQTKAEEKAKAKEEEERKKAEAVKKRADAKAAATAEEERKKKEAAERRAAKKADKANPFEAPAASAAITPPGKETVWPFPVGEAVTGTDKGKKPLPAHLAALPQKPQVLADFRAMEKKHGKKARNRKFFVKKSETGRRYEKLWANWADFLAEVDQLPLPLEPKAATSAPLEPADDRTKRMIEAANALTADDDEPALKKGEATDTFTHVFDQAGVYLSSITSKPELGKHIGLTSEEYLLRVTAIDTRPDGGLDVSVAPDPEYTAHQAEKTAQAVREQAAARAEKERPHKIAVLEHKSRALLGEFAGAPKAGEIIRLDNGGGPLRVDRVTAGVEILAHKIHADPYTLHDERDKVIGGTYEIYAVGDKPSEIGEDIPGDFRVERIDPETQRYHLKDHAKPRFKMYSEDDELLSEYKWAPSVGEKLQVEGRAHHFKVVMVDGHRVTARPVLPTKSRIVDHLTNEVLGHTEEVYDVADQVAELAPKDYRVMRVAIDAYQVKLSKPRITGPAAVLQAQE